MPVGLLSVIVVRNLRFKYLRSLNAGRNRLPLIVFNLNPIILKPNEAVRNSYKWSL